MLVHFILGNAPIRFIEVLRSILGLRNQHTDKMDQAVLAPAATTKETEMVQKSLDWSDIFDVSRVQVGLL